MEMPNNIEAERAVLGCMLLDPAVIPAVSELLTEEDFYSAAHRQIYAAIFAMAERNSNVDMVMVSEQLERQHMLEQVGGIVYLSELSRQVPSVVNAMEYVRIVEEKSLLRRLLRAGGDIAQLAENSDQPMDQLMDSCERLIFDISLSKKGDSLRPIREVLLEAYAQLGEAAANAGGLSGVPTGFAKLDKMTFGLQPSDLIIIAGRPSMGKTSFAMNIAQYAALKGKAVAVFSLEMSKEQLVRRMLCAQAGVDMEKARTGDMNEQDFVNLAQAMNTLAAAQMYIDDTSSISTSEMRSKLRKLKMEGQLDMVLIDYLQLMTGGKAENRTQEVAGITRALKGIAKELNVPVVVLSQLSRGPEARADKRPMMSDLRESGAIEQDADIVILLFREAFYNPEANNVSEAIVAKHRNGSTGTIKLVWQGQYTRFVNYDERAEGGMP